MSESSREGFPIKITGANGTARTAEEIAADIRYQLKNIQDQGGTLLADSVHIAAYIPREDPESIEQTPAKDMTDQFPALRNDLL